jgi:outer membrane protein assembly factor BamB
VVADGRVIAATENNRVVALDPITGQIVWSASIGTPLTDIGSAAGCGDIDPLGITSTPVVDLSRGTVFVVGEVDDGNGAVHHQLVGLNVQTGKVVRSEAADPPLAGGERAVHLLQRASLALANGRVYISYGGNDGDCGDYHGWVVGIQETGAPRMVSFEAAPDAHGGAIWQGGGAPAVDANGNLYVATGNANPAPPEGGPDAATYAESVVKLSPALQVLATFKDQHAGGDADFGTGNPVLLPGGRVFAVGKTNIGYVLNQANLAQLATIHGICGSDPDGGPAYDAAGDSVFVPCRDGGIQQVDLGANTVERRMRGANSAPILIGSTLWALQYPDGTLTQYDLTGGRVLQQLDVGASVPHFASPSTALGRIFVGTERGVAAFSG